TDTVKVTIDGHTNPPSQIRQLYVTMNGEDPIPESNSNGRSSPYTFNLGKATTIKAIATQLGWTNSEVVTREYEFYCGDVTMVPPAGTYTGAISVTLSTTTPSSSIYYTTDGSAVNGAATLY